jgi:hypothetical protein
MMKDPTNLADQLESVKWHILRSDAQRIGLWTRAAAVLSADTLVIAGAAVMLTLGTRTFFGTLVAALAALILVLISVGWAANAIAVVKNWSKRSLLPNFPPPMIFSLPETVTLAGSFTKFHKIVLTETIEARLDNAISELWRISVLHRNRIHQLRQAVYWLILGVASLAISGLLEVIAIWPGI